jgi:hypothetical protein
VATRDVHCEFGITDSSFSETFTAVPKPGFDFVKWQDRSGFFCANSTDPSCTVEMPNQETGESIITLFQTGSIRPIFNGPEGVLKAAQN